MRDYTGRRARDAGRALLLGTASLVGAFAAGADAGRNAGPYHVTFLPGGIGLERPLAADSAPLAAGAAWTLGGWLRAAATEGPRRVVAALGDPAEAGCRFLVLERGHLVLEAGDAARLEDPIALEPGVWHYVAAIFDGNRAALFVDGAVRAEVAASTQRVAARLLLAPESAADPAGERHFGGALAAFALEAGAVGAATLRERAAHPPDFSLLPFHAVGVGWPWQEHAWRGLLEPQPAWTLPQGLAPANTPVRRTLATTAPLTPAGTDRWSIGGWRLEPASAVTAAASEVARPGYDDRGWLAAAVPGTVLTTLVENGIYPDPDVGLNNLAIPESLARQDYWYRTEFTVPRLAAARRLTLGFAGINYAAEVWLNGERLGAIRGAFRRGSFELSGRLRADGPNVLAVRVSPPPHPGIPHEQSVAAGPGENGGSLAIDGPTFIATEGWDWIPAVRDRNTGLWQGVELAASGTIRIGDAFVITQLPLPRTDRADLTIRVPLDNLATRAVGVRLRARFDDVDVVKSVVASPGASEVELSPAEFPALRVAQPRLWWPNGYGEPVLHALTLSVDADGEPSDARELRFGIREITYELSLFDSAGRLRRVEVDPTAGLPAGERLVDVRHEALKRTAGGWAASLTTAGERSAAVREQPPSALAPHLVLRVNGVAIAARGGSWGMDDSRKRVARERLEPFFELHRRAHLNTIRNWLGQDTEEAFYALADEYGLLVLNDFWASTQDFQVEPQDPALFLDNAADVIRRYRHHPSIALWFGRNEGVPQPVINEGLADLVATLDGTRYYTGSSNRVNLQDSGPYNWRPPAGYFGELARGFAVEVGTPSLAERESLEAWIAPADRWPVGDAYAYHDWHFGGNGDTASFQAALERRLGAPRDFPDFVEKAQVLNYESHRAIFEGFNAGLWTRNSGRLLWMTHPAWPSNAWQIYTADYETPAAYFAVAKACEPLHVQLDLPDLAPRLVNIGGAAADGLALEVRAVSLDGRMLLRRTLAAAVGANDVAALAKVPLAPLVDAEGIVVVDLTLRDRDGRVRSRNTYWPARDEAAERRLATLPPAKVALSAAGIGERVEVTLVNHSPQPALFVRVGLRDPHGARVLPAYYADNYVSLLPGETRRLGATCPARGAPCASLEARGLNLAPVTVPIARARTVRTPASSGASP
ncbi:MAG: beta galactosidase jelly roll domain-containing protein [Proteobacteria bacterium]|nr:beta galactosidase jelly roll domain-containing protein [Pseudomonadota bacterium]